MSRKFTLSTLLILSFNSNNQMQETNEKTIESWSEFLDLRLALSVELGKARIKIREFLELKPSSLIKLSRSTGEGVDVRVDDKSLLRGEVIVIEDRAAVRVSEIVINEN
jgi:flagellar motor switch protein FliN